MTCVPDTMSVTGGFRRCLRPSSAHLPLSSTLLLTIGSLLLPRGPITG
jgi:hypothetical protein